MKYKINLIFKAIVLSFIISFSGLSFAASPITDLSYLPGNYVEAKAFKGGFAAVKDESGKWGFINRSGKLVIPHKYDDAGEFSEKRVCVGMTDSIGNIKYGYIDKNDKLLIPFEYEKGYEFKDGLACVRRLSTEGEFEFGYINKSGKLVIPYQYADAAGFINGLACVLGKSQLGTMKYGYIDKKGNIVIPLSYDVAYSFVDGIACVANKYQGKSKYGYINEKNEVVLPLKYQDAFSFSNGYATVMQDDNIYSVIDKSGNIIFSNNKGVIKKRKNDMIMTRNEDLNKWGYADIEGKLKVDYKYYEAYDFSEGLACVVEGMGYDNTIRKYGYIDVNGDMIITPQFDYLFENSDFSQGFAVVKLSNGKYGYLRNPVTGGKIVDETVDVGKGDKIIATPVNPVVTKPVVTEPVVTKPVVTEPVVTKPVVTKPVVTKPVVTKPVVTKPVVTKPVVTKPIATKPKPSGKNTIVLKSPSGLAKPLEDIRPSAEKKLTATTEAYKGVSTVILSTPKKAAKPLATK